MEHLIPKSSFNTAPNFLKYHAVKKATAASTAIPAWHKQPQVGFICLLSKAVEWIKAGEG